MDCDQFPGCCGAYVIHDFEELEDCENEAARKACIDDFIEQIDDIQHGKLVMAVLVDSQLQQGWLSVLHRAGFRRAERWINSNHGNVCNLFIMQKACTPAPKYKGRSKKGK